MFTKLAKLLSPSIRKEEGFTLIELLIVVAIIAILAAIAIPQFSAYRIRGYNSAATADLRNAKTAEEAFFSDWQVYASSAATGVPGAGVVLTNATAVPQATIAALAISATAPSSATTFSTGMSAGVGLVINTSASGGSYTIADKNSAGDRCYGTESDFAPIYFVNGAIGSPMLIAANPVAVASTVNSDYNTVAGVSPCTGGVQLTWTAL